MKKLKSNLSQLIEENKEEIIRNRREMDKIEEKVDMKYTTAKKEHA
ncbi:FbpB family small basic protein [Rossellomorea vietnamensis]|uniref:FbpB family small basic protein n=1 Tax=Rossellomorea vietnamensis TaxID=218284 RepID=A0ACD4C9I4_9BACI|nr:FbpB family small basic protein [Rossellomorea vietnamensis]UXH45069.1 FbpB family small basic protein [Rossellomorea vietnamensis]WQI96431.1 FbpB family small basic protein [Rossellomorea vietnamensis]